MPKRTIIGIAAGVSLAALTAFCAHAQSSEAAPPPVVEPATDADVRLNLPLPPSAEVVLPAAAPIQTAAPEPAPAGPSPSEMLKMVFAEWMKAPALGGRFAASAQVQRKEREALAEFYESRDFKPLWVAQGRWTQDAQALIARLEHAGDDGLDLAATALPPAPKTPVEAAQAELALDEAALAYARQASGGRVDPQNVSQLITVQPETPDPARVIAGLAEAGAEAGAALQAYNPPHKGYELLRRKLAELRQARLPAARERIPAGPALRVGMRDPRVPLIRSRFGLDSAPSAEPADLVYDTQVAAAIADFQRANGLPASGVLTPRTIAALSGGEPSRLENEILANMERWRWLPRDLGAEHIEVNIPEFTVKVLDHATLRHQARVVVGKPDTPTPVFSNVMQFLIVNPYWSVPQSIIKKEMLPRLAADPNYLHRLGYEVVRRGNVIYVRQPPGERNALGRIKFMFPNDHAVYLHDTPSRALFANEIRAFSHGCVRVDQPFQLAETVLGAQWSEPRLKALIGGPERTLRLPKPLPIHIEYFTAGVDDAGRLQLHDDIYGYSRRLQILMGLES